MKALIIIDAQNDFIDGCLGTREAQEAVPRIVKLIESFDGDIYYTKDNHSKPSYWGTLEGERIPEHCMDNTEGQKINTDISNAIMNSDCEFTKIDKTSFGSILLSTKLYPHFSWKDGERIETTYDEFIVCGFCTDICVISNALILRAGHPNTPIRVVADCCAGTTPEMHRAALQVMNNCLIDII